MKRNPCGTMLTGAVLACSVALIGACARSDNQFTDCKEVDPTRDVDVRIEFYDNGCPKGVDKGNDDVPFDVATTDRINWQSYDSKGNKPEYEIFFDPFKAHPLKSSNGKRQSPKFDNCAPKVEYKYTIVAVGDTCTEQDKKALDPRFRLR